MARLRRLLKRLLKPAAMTAVVGTLSLSLIITTPSTSRALVDGASTAVVAGAMRTGLPHLLLAAARLHPVGFAITTAGALGLALYEEREHWYPFVAGLWGGGKDSGDSYAVGSAFPREAHTLDGVITSGKTASIKQTFASASSGTSSWHVAYRIECKWNDGSPNTIFADVRNYSLTGIPYNQPMNFDCQAVQNGVTRTGIPVGVEAGLAGNGMLPPLETGDKPGGPSNYVSWGNAIKGGFDPYGAGTVYTAYAECIDVNGTISVVSKTTMGGDMKAIQFPSCVGQGKGHGTGKMWVTGLRPESTVEETLWETEVPDYSEYPLCSTARPDMGCVMSIQVDGKECVIGVWECEHWTEVNQQDTTRVQCKYGPYTLTVDRCGLLEPAYRTGGAPATSENIDGNPATRNFTEPSGQQYTQPRTGTGAPPVTGIVPGGPATSAPPGSSQQQAECFPSGWGMLNPVEWVMKPIGCALDAAFTPKKSLQTRIDSMQAQFGNKVPMTWFGLGTSGVSGGGCPTNWALDVSGQHVSLICGTPAEGIIQSFRPVMGAMLVIAAIWPLLRSLFYAAIPVFRVTPS